jgi:hypothetical protein
MPEARRFRSATSGKPYWTTVRVTWSGGCESGSGFGVGFVRGVLLMFALSFVLVASTVPGIGRSSPEEAQPFAAIVAPTKRSER